MWPYFVLISPRSSFRCGILDNCAEARLYTRFLELYALWPIELGLRCPLEGCGERFPDQQEMLKHLKRCEHMADGVFWCPTCHQWEKFRTRTGRRCSWKREPFGQKFVQKSRDVIRSLTGNSPGAQQAKALCDQCSRCLETLTRDGHSSTSCGQADSASLWQAELGPPSQLDAPSSLGELSGDSISIGLQQRPARSPTSVSELSADIISPNGNLTDTVSSLDSPDRTEQPATTYFSGPGRLLNDMEISEIDPTHHVQSRRYCSLYGNALTSPGFNIPPTHSINAPTSEMPFVSSAFLPSHTKHLSLHIPDLGLEALASVPLQEFHSNLDGIPHFGDFTPEDNMFMGAHDTANSLFQPSSLVASPIILDPQLQANTSMEITLHQGLSNSSPIAELPATEIVFVDEQNSPDTSLQPSLLLVDPMMPSSRHPSSPPSTEEEQAEVYKCPKCDYRPDGLIRRSYKSYLRKHMENRHGQRRSIPCEHCDHTFTRRDNLTNHLRKKHSIDNTCNLKRYRTSPGSSRPAPPNSRTLRARSSQYT